eukprot:6195063-Pleurochrysis_carterae.AAC.1
MVSKHFHTKASRCRTYVPYLRVSSICTMAGILTACALVQIQKNGMSLRLYKTFPRFLYISNKPADDADRLMPYVLKRRQKS